jgi:hypothetical protein
MEQRAGNHLIHRRIIKGLRPVTTIQQQHSLVSSQKDEGDTTRLTLSQEPVLLGDEQAMVVARDELGGRPRWLLWCLQFDPSILARQTSIHVRLAISNFILDPVQAIHIARQMFTN